MAAYYQDGKLVRRSSGTTVKDEAQKKLRVALGDIDAGTAPPPGEIPTVATLCQLVLDDYTRNGRRSGRDVERAYGYLERFSGDRPAQSITVADVDAYIAARLAGRVPGGREAKPLRPAGTEGGTGHRQTDGGFSWNDPVRVSSASSDARGSAFQRGDYQGLAVAQGHVYPAWSDYRTNPGGAARNGEVYVGRLLFGDGEDAGRDTHHRQVTQGARSRPSSRPGRSGRLRWRVRRTQLDRVRARFRSALAGSSCHQCRWNVP